MAIAGPQASTRDQLVLAAVVAVASKGPDRVTIRDVADEAGVTTGTVHYHFDDKANLLEQTLLHVSTRIRDRTFPALRETSGREATVARLVEAMLPASESEFRDWQIWLAAWAEASRSATMRVVIRERMQQWDVLLSDVIRQHHPELDAQQVSDRCIAINATLDGLIVAAVARFEPGGQTSDLRHVGIQLLGQLL